MQGHRFGARQGARLVTRYAPQHASVAGPMRWVRLAVWWVWWMVTTRVAVWSHLARLARAGRLPLAAKEGIADAGAAAVFLVVFVAVVFVVAVLT